MMNSKLDTWCFLQEGGEYHLEIFSSEGVRYESEYEILHPASEIIDLYYEIESLPTSDPEVRDQGIRFSCFPLETPKSL